MSDFITISRGLWRADIAPAHGACVASLAFGGFDVFRPAESEALAKDPINAGCYLCAPWFGRLFSPVFRDGKSFELPPNHESSNAPLHGEVWLNPWRIVERQDSSIACEYENTPDAGRFPFRFGATARYAISEREFSVTLSVANLDRAAMPIGLGIHPFFNRAKTSRLKIDAKKFWTPPFRKGEQGSYKEVPQHFCADALSSLPNQLFDDTFLTTGEPVLIALDERIFALCANTTLWHHYAPPDQAFFCLEPITQLPGKFGETELEPGASKELILSISPLENY